MEKDRRTREIAIIALCIAVVGLSIGFAAFTRDLNIQFSESNVNISGDLDIKLLASDDPNDTNTTIYPMTLAISSTSATISLDYTTLNNLSATFNNKGQLVAYKIYIYNNSEYDAYIKSIDFLNYTGTDANKVCTALEGTTQSLVDAACEDIHIYAASGNLAIMPDTDQSVISSMYMQPGEIVPIQIFIVYANKSFGEQLGKPDVGTSILPNGDFKVNFGNIKFNFSSLKD